MSGGSSVTSSKEDLVTRVSGTRGTEDEIMSGDLLES